MNQHGKHKILTLNVSERHVDVGDVEDADRVGRIMNVQGQTHRDGGIQYSSDDEYFSDEGDELKGNETRFSHGKNESEDGSDDDFEDDDDEVREIRFKKSTDHRMLSPHQPGEFRPFFVSRHSLCIWAVAHDEQQQEQEVKKRAPKGRANSSDSQAKGGPASKKSASFKRKNASEVASLTESTTNSKTTSKSSAKFTETPET